MDNLSEIFIEAGTLMLAGMCFVFLFLGLLIFAINYVLAPLAKKYPDPTPVAKAKPRTSVASAASGTPAEVVAAISSAVKQYRNNNNFK